MIRLSFSADSLVTSTEPAIGTSGILAFSVEVTDDVQPPVTAALFRIVGQPTAWFWGPFEAAPTARVAHGDVFNEGVFASVRAPALEGRSVLLGIVRFYVTMTAAAQMLVAAHRNAPRHNGPLLYAGVPTRSVPTTGGEAVVLARN